MLNQSRQDNHSTSTIEDQTLIEAIVNGDSNSLSILFNRYNRYLMGVAYNVLGSKELAEEVVLDTFTRVWEKGKTYDRSKGTLRGWMTRLARNRAIDVLRQSGQKMMDRSVEWTEVHDNIISSGINPEKATDLSIMAQKVRDAMQDLPEEQRDLIELAYFKGLSNSKISAATGIPLGTVKTRIRLGMQKLREAMLPDRSTTA